MYAVIHKVRWTIPQDLMATAMEEGEALAREDFLEEAEEEGNFDAVFDPSEAQEEILAAAHEWYRCKAELPKLVVFYFDGDRKGLSQMSNAELLNRVNGVIPGHTISSCNDPCPASAKDKADFRAYTAFHEMLQNSDFQKVLSLQRLKYSFHNTMSVYDTARRRGLDVNRLIVRGYRSWEKDFNRVPQGKGIGIPIAVTHVPVLKADPTLTDDKVEEWVRKQWKYLPKDRLQKKVDWAIEEIHQGKNVEAYPFCNEIYVYDVSDTVVIEGKEDKLGKLLEFDKASWLDTPELRTAVLSVVNKRIGNFGETAAADNLYEELSAYVEACFAHPETIPKVGNPLPMSGLKHKIEKLLAIGIISEAEGFGLSDTVNRELQYTFANATGDKQFLFESMLRRASALADQWSKDFEDTRKALLKGKEQAPAELLNESDKEQDDEER